MKTRSAHTDARDKKGVRKSAVSSTRFDLDVSRKQIAAIFAWARRTPPISAVYLFGSRAKAISHPCSDLDLAVIVQSTPGLTNKNSFDKHWLEWVTEIEDSVGLKVDLLRLHVTETPRTAAGVDEAGCLLYQRDSDQFFHRVQRNDLAVARRLDTDHPRHNYSLVPLEEIADLFVAEEQSKHVQNTAVGEDARKRFFARLIASVRQREFEGKNRLFVINGTVVRFDRQALLSEYSTDISDDPIASYWSKTWASRMTATSWCQRHRFRVPPRWIATSSPQSKTGRPDKTEGVLKEYARRQAAGCAKDTVEAESKYLEAWAQTNLPEGQHPAARTISKRIGGARTPARK